MYETRNCVLDVELRNIFADFDDLQLDEKVRLQRLMCTLACMSEIGFVVARHLYWGPHYVRE